MHEDREIAEERLQRIRHRWVKPAIWSPRVPFELSTWEVPEDADGLVGEPRPVEDALAADFTPISAGAPWGRPWGTTWFRLRGQVPPDWAGRPVEAIVNLGFGSDAPGFVAEGMVWRAGEGGAWEPERGLHPANHTWRLLDAANGDEEFELLVEAAGNPPISDLFPDPNSDRLTAWNSPVYVVSEASLAVVDLDVYGLHHDLRALVGLMRELPLFESLRWELLAAAERCMAALDPADVAGSAKAARAELAEVLARRAVPSAHRISAVGHAHIDSAWLWPIRETVRKCARTFSNVLRLAEQRPELVFACSQAAQYEWMLERYPSVFAGMQEAAARGQWVPVGGMWVEADGNVTGGEAMVRQLVHGQRFFREHFGVTCSEVWIPDVFGYPASLPQIFRLGGCDRFLTQKLSWNRTNRFPHHTFRWEGIDGTQVFTHFPPVDTYNASIEPFELAKVERNFADKGRATRSLMPFGFGDGGGGPNREMLERYDRLRDLEGLPRITMDSPAAFFDAAIEEYTDAPVWVGELYLEMHRGTLTSQARTKVGNRRSELLLREAELFCVAAYGGRAADGYPAAELDRIWKTVLLLQFHDILPGSSIGWVHREAEATYAEIESQLEAIIGAALARLGHGPTLANAAPHDRDEVVVVEPVDGLAAEHVQGLSDGRVAFRAEAPALGVAPAVPRPLDVPVVVESRSLDNGVLRVELGDDGYVRSLVHRASGREVLAAGGRGGLLQLHHDDPIEYDAWDIEEYYRRSVIDLDEAVSIEVVDQGPAVGRIRVVREFRASRVVQTWELRAGSGRLDCHVELDWQERSHLLKLAWPVDVHTSDVVRHIQYGHLRTPVHTNTSWDHARFEICAHQWIDAGEPGFGVALLNDGRYGHDVTRTRGADGASSTTMRLTVVKGAQFPDPKADLGSHRFCVSVMPHAGKFRKEGVVEEGYRVNLPVRLVAGTGPAAVAGAAPVITVDTPAVVVEALKAAEDGSGDVIVRCYEAFGGRAAPTLRLARPAATVTLTDLLEEDPPPSPAPALEVVDDETLRLTLRPFQIATLRITPA